MLSEFHYSATKLTRNFLVAKVRRSTQVEVKFRLPSRKIHRFTAKPRQFTGNAGLRGRLLWACTPRRRTPRSTRPGNPRSRSPRRRSSAPRWPRTSGQKRWRPAECSDSSRDRMAAPRKGWPKACTIIRQTLVQCGLRTTYVCLELPSEGKMSQDLLKNDNLPTEISGNI